MCEILFRAKRTDNGKWVEGFYYSLDQKHYIIPQNLSALLAVEVIPETVGQYIGLLDKDGKKIFEGDALAISTYSYHEPEDQYFGAVNMGGVLGNFLWNDNGVSVNPMQKAFPIYECFGSYTTVYEILGNIHDNPELLEAANDRQA